MQTQQFNLKLIHSFMWWMAECTLYSSTTHTIVNCNKLGSPFGNQDQQAGAQLLQAAQPHPSHLTQARINPQKC